VFQHRSDATLRRNADRWGGVDPARRILIDLRKRADLEGSGGAFGARIDGYSTHHARGLAPQALA